MPSPLYAVHHYPPKIRARDGRELLAVPLGREAVCVRCPKASANLTIVGYRDSQQRKTWPTCYACAREVSEGEKPPAGDWEPYD